MGPGGLNSLTISTASGRSSVLNPFSHTPSPNTIKINKTLDGRRSVMPAIGGGSQSVNGVHKRNGTTVH
jgi:hypothetical protein